ncbi:MAG: hypothetical protein WKG32_22060 [Gemmatimonadaceae bacterium]
MCTKPSARRCSTVIFARDSTGRATTATLVQAGPRTVVQRAEVTR